MIKLDEIKDSDYDRYLDLMYQLTNYKYDISRTDFISKIRSRNNVKILVLRSGNEIIGAGTIFKLEKLHNNPIGQIEDVIIDVSQRKNGYGKLIIDELVKYGLKEFNCYKIVLNSLDKNLEFYAKCNFIKVSNQLKYETCS
jgi:predicted GNAT family N-acyltransferase